MKDKIYRVLASRENISTTQAKKLIDNGLVYYMGKKVIIARALVDMNAKFSILKQECEKIIFQDDKLLVLNKPSHITSEELSKKYNLELLHRLDKDTSGVLILVKDIDFKNLAIKEFKAMRVNKEYFAIVNGVFSDEIIINKPILTFKKGSVAVSKIDKSGKNAITRVYPFMVCGKKSLVRVTIDTGRTHQIRVHLADCGFGIVGDEKYAKNSSKRIYLHSHKIEFLNYKFVASIPKDFNEFGFNV